MNNILIVATTSYAGMGPYVTGIVNTFSDTDNVCFLFHDYEDNFFRKNVKESLLAHSYFYKKKNSSWNKLKDLFCQDKAFERMLLGICKSEDVKLVHFINGPVSEELSKKLETLGIATLGTVHDLHPHEAKKVLHKMLRHKILSKRTLAAINYDKNLATNSKVQLDELKSLYPQKNLFLYDFPSLISPEVEKGHDVPSELKDLKEQYILFFGRIEEYKGIELLYQAFIEDDEINSKLHLVVAGGGTIPFQRRDDEHNVVIINRYIKDSEVRYLYEHAACVVYPYISATQSGVLSVAYYFKTPVLTSDVPFFRGIIEPSNAGVLFKTGDVEDLKTKLIYLLQSDITKLKNAESKYYAEHYHGDAIRQQLLKIYDKVSSN
jgi:glycosyltransferase involved in cell wall biosynthesis